MTNRASLVLAAAVCAAIASACPTGGPNVIVPPDDALASCVDSSECSNGQICIAGGCVSGSCDPAIESQCDLEGLDSELCCKPWELCSTLSFQCENDPDVDGIGCDGDDPTCTPCETQGDCAAGQFCSGATCLDADGRDQCTSSFQCPAGERCDRNVFLCVPDRGACQFCESFAELCCENDQICSEDGRCVDIPDPECTVETQAVDCNAGQFCDSLFRCVQCDDDGDCGPGLFCNEAEGECFADNQCDDDDDCNGAQLCAPATSECTLAECTSDGDCLGDSRLVCDLGTYRCELPPPVCPEEDDLDEPNDDTSTASPMTDFTFDGYLCRDDTDLLSFPVIANKRYTATVDFGGSGQGGIIVTMLGTTFVVESTKTFGSNEATVQVAGVTAPDETGFFYVKVQGNNEDSDNWLYTVTVAEDEPSQPADCTEAGQPEEDNGTFETAHPITVGATQTFSRCGTGDVDFFRVAVPALNGIQVTVDSFFNAEGNINVELFKAPNNNTGSKIDQGTNVNDIEIVEGAEVAREFWIKVSLASPAGAVTDQTYRLRTVAVPRPEACFPDPSEDDGTFADAEVLTLTGAPEPSVVVTDIVRCNPQDKDFFRFTMPPNLGGSVLLRFTHSEGDMRLELFRAADFDDNPTPAPLATSNTSNTNSDPDEQVTVPGGTEPIDYIAVASLNGTSGITAQKYTLEVQTFDDSQCIASEPSGGDDAFRLGRCIGNFTPLRTEDPCVNEGARISEPMLTAIDVATCEGAPEGTINGCGRMCGNSDSDWYRVGILNNDQILHAILDYDPAEGELALARGTLTTATGAVVETASTDSDHDGHLELSFAAPRNQPKEYGIRVKPIGTTGHQVQSYALKIEVGAECPEDPNDLGTLVNEKPVDATVIRPNFDEDTPLDFVSSGLTRCTNDIDVYELTVFAGETVTVEIDQADTSPNGLIAELGTRPANLNNPAVLIDSVVAGEGPLTFANTTGQDLYVTVKAPTGTIVTGPYTLRVTAGL
jgi:hypothetical protein